MIGTPRTRTFFILVTSSSSSRQPVLAEVLGQIHRVLQRWTYLTTRRPSRHSLIPMKWAFRTLNPAKRSNSTEHYRFSKSLITRKLQACSARAKIGVDIPLAKAETTWSLDSQGLRVGTATRAWIAEVEMVDQHLRTRKMTIKDSLNRNLTPLVTFMIPNPQSRTKRITTPPLCDRRFAIPSRDQLGRNKKADYLPWGLTSSIIGRFRGLWTAASSPSQARRSLDDSIDQRPSRTWQSMISSGLWSKNHSSSGRRMHATPGEHPA